MVKKAITVTLPAPHKAKIKCPICAGNKCKVCNMTGNLGIDVAPQIPIQRAHIIKYVVENIIYYRIGRRREQLHIKRKRGISVSNWLFNRNAPPLQHLSFKCEVIS